MTEKHISITKTSGGTVPFEIQKLSSSLERSGVNKTKHAGIIKEAYEICKI